MSGISSNNINAGTPFLQGVANSLVSKEWFRFLTRIVATAFTWAMPAQINAGAPTAYQVSALDTTVISNFTGTLTLSLPQASKYPGRPLWVRTTTAHTLVSDSANVIPLAGGSPGTAILGAAAGNWAMLVSDGTYWEVQAGAGAGGTGTVTSIDVSGGTTGLTFSGGPISTSGTITMAGKLAVANGGTNSATALTGNQIVISSGGALVEGGAMAAGTIMIGQTAAAPAPKAMSGDATITNLGALTIAAGAVTLAKMANLAANSVIGNNTGAGATPIALTQAQLTAMVNAFTATLSGAAPSSGGGTTNFLRADGAWSAPAGASANLRGAFLAYLSANQTGLTGGANNKVNLDTDSIDIDSWFDAATNHRYTPLVAGTYLIFGMVRTTQTATDAPQALIYKNGSLVYQGTYTLGGIASAISSISVGLLTMNGSTDFAELYAYLPLTITQVNGGAAIVTYLGGVRLSA